MSGIANQYNFDFERIVGSRKFADPFLMHSSETFPLQLETAMDFCLFLFFLNPEYRQASMRVIAHFMTDLEFGKEGSIEEQNDTYDFLKDTLDVMGALRSLGEDWAAYGNGFARIAFPFNRLLRDRRDGRIKDWDIGMFGNHASFNLQTMKYTVPDPVEMSRGVPIHQAKKVEFDFYDRKSLDRSRISIVRIDPRYVTLQHSMRNGVTRVIETFPPDFVASIKRGDMWQVDATPRAVLEAIRNNEDFLYNADEVFHYKAPTVMGVSNNGWGLPETIANYRLLHQLQVYRKIDEAVGLDYLMPFRLFTPNISDNIGSNVQNLLMSQWTSKISSMIKARRADPFAMHAMPFPVTYQEFGGEGKRLVLKDLIEYSTNNMLDAMGYPAELYRGSLQVAQIPTTLRLFENTFHFIPHNNNKFVRWVATRVQDYLGLPRIIPVLERPSLADDMEERSIYLQMAAGGEITRKKAYKPWGIVDPVAEAIERQREDLEIQKEVSKLQADAQREAQVGSGNDLAAAQQAEQQAAQQAAAQQGGAMPGGLPMGGLSGNGGPVTPLTIQREAQEYAMQLEGMDIGPRRRMLDQIRASNPVLHAAVMQELRNLRASNEAAGREQGRAQLRQQQ
jgi:hypothetical protein